jgi:hypothetical protein
MRKAAFTFAAVVVFGIASTSPCTAATDPTYRMVPSDRTVLPGQIVTITVQGDIQGWGGGVNSYFERRRRDGSWQRLYMLLWYDNGHRGPSVVDYNSLVDDLLVRASPFQAIIPAVEPGVYRIVRTFATAPGHTQDRKTLSTRVTVTACPKGQRPTFATPSPTRAEYGTPGCAT